MTPLYAIRTRILPALLTALGAVIVTAGLMSLADGGAAATAGASPTVPPGVIETLAPSVQASGSPAPSSSRSATPSATLPPSAGVASATPSGSARPSSTVRATATRVVMPALGIDLPVIRPPGGPDAYPSCNVGMYIKELGQPGEGHATYIYAHARAGMFGPIYDLAIQRGTPRRMLGMTVDVYTSDDRLYVYEVTEVRLHQTNLDDALAARGEELWLQTSEGPRGTPGKTQLIARPVSVGPADAADAHPSAKPVACG